MNKVQRYIIVGKLCDKYCKKKKCLKYEKKCKEIDYCEILNEDKEIEDYISECYYTTNNLNL